MKSEAVKKFSPYITFLFKGDLSSKVQQGIANDRPKIAQKEFKNREKPIGGDRQDLNLRPSAPKAPATKIAIVPMRNK